MKIRNKFLIPVIAIFVAILMVGSPLAGTAVDTSASQSAGTSIDPATHPHTYIPSTFPPTSSFEEEIDAMVSENLGGLGQYGDDVRDFGGVMGGILKTFTDFIDNLIEIFKKIGGFLSGNWIGG